MPKLTKRTIEALPVEAVDYIIWDDDIAGFGVRVYRSGRKSYLVQYRAGGRTRRRSIAQHSVMTVEEARKEARGLLGEVAKGGNPAEDRARRFNAPTINALCDRFLEEYVAQHCKPSTQQNYISVLTRCVKPELGNHKVEDITRADIVEFHYGRRGTPYMANRAVAMLSKMFNLAEDWGIRREGTNPAKRVKKFREEEKKRYLSDAEQLDLGNALADALDRGQETIYAVSAIYLLMLTGCRLGEILKLKWDYVTPHHLELPDSKTGRRRIPLPREAYDIISALPRMEGNSHVILGESKTGHLVNLNNTWLRVRKQAGLEDVRMHDLRHTYASVAVMSGIDPFLLKEIMGHKSLQTTLRYAHLSDDAVQRAAGSVASKLVAAIRPLTKSNLELRSLH